MVWENRFILKLGKDFSGERGKRDKYLGVKRVDGMGDIDGRLRIRNDIR